jgi:RHS repeat-associated protein
MLRTSRCATAPAHQAALALALLGASLLATASYAQAVPPGPMTWIYGYDTEGNLTATTDPNGHVTEHTYDSLQRRRTTTLPLPTALGMRPLIQMDYDGRDQLSRVVDSRNLPTTYTTDGLGNTSAQQSPDSGATTATYDAAGNLLTRTDARGITHAYSYDALNRLTRIDYPSGTATVYEYDGGATGAPNAIGRLTKITDESGSTSYSYDGFGHVTSKTQVVNSAAGSRSFTVATQWGESGISTGKPIRIIYPSGASVEIGYEKNGQSCAGRPCFITVTRNGQTSVLLENLAYNALHALAGWTWGDGTAYQRTFDSFARLKTYPLGNPAGSGNAMGIIRTLEYDNAGRITGYTHSGGQVLHSYDGLDRLIDTQGAGTSYGYQYDATGNRTRRLIGGVGYANEVQSTSNRLSHVQEPGGSGTVTRNYTYDSAGNLTYDGINTFIYSARGRMSRADTPNGSVSYLINGLEQRVSKTGLTVSSGAAYYVYDEEGHTIGEYDVNGNPVYEVVYLGDMPVGMVTALGINYIYADHIDTPRVITRSQDHAIVWRWDEVEAFGAVPPNEDPSDLGTLTFDLRFPGQVFDRETGLFYNWHRNYSASIGHYTQPDPIGLTGGLNPYAYVENNPVDSVDPDGLTRRGGARLPRTGSGGPATPPGPSGPKDKFCAIYLHFDCHRAIVYIGRTNDWDRREYEHQHRSRGKINRYRCDSCPVDMVPLGWWTGERGVSYCYFLEKTLIGQHKPIFNDADTGVPADERQKRRSEWRKKNNCDC